MTFEDAPEVLSVQQVAQLLGCSTTLVYDSISAGELPHRRLRGRIFVLKKALVAFFEGQK